MRSLSLVLALVLCSGAVMAQITVKGGNADAVNVPVSVACDEALEGAIAVVDTKSKKSYPATLKDGELTFIMDALKKGATAKLEVKAAKEATPRVQVVKQEDARILDVLIDGVHFTSYYYSNDYMKPFLWPVNSIKQTGVTRDYPMADIENKKAKDHPHHKSLWTSFGDIGGADCWGEGENSGYQVGNGISFGSGDAYGWIKATNVWQDKERNAVISEAREYRFYATPEAGRLMDVLLTFTADRGSVHWVDTKEGGLVAVRMRPELCHKNAHISNALGDVGESACWGKPSPWCDYAGPMDGVGFVGLTVFDHPTNMRYPTSWHVRDYGLMGANCFGYSYFSEKEHNKGLIPENGDFDMAEGDVLNMQYRVYVHAGDVKEAKVAERYADYATPPTATWVK